MVQRPGRAGEGLPLCEPGEGPVGPGGARKPGSPEAALGALGAREPDASHADVELRRGARGATALPEPIPLPPPASLHGPGGQVCTGQPRAPSPPSSGRGPGGDGAGTELAELEQTARPQHKGKLGRGRSAESRGASVPRPPGASQGCIPPHLGWGVIEGGFTATW